MARTAKPAPQDAPAAGGKAAPGKDEAALAEARKRLAQAVEAEAENRKNYVADTAFSCADDQWDPAVKRARGTHRPALTFNRLNQVVKQIIGDYRQNKLAVRVVPASGDASEATADLFAGLIRNIEAQSRADVAYAVALECAARGGFGWFRVGTAFAGDGFDQDLRILPVYNPLTVYCDPAARSPTREDAEWVIVTELVNKERFRKEHPNVPPTGFDGGDDAGWCQGDDVRVAEYYAKERHPARVAALSDGSVVEIDDDAQVEALAQLGLAVTRERTADRTRIRYRKMVANAVLEERLYKAGTLPLVRVAGEEVNVEGRVLSRSAIFYAKDAQRTYNYSKTTAVEMTALAPKAPWIVTPAQIAGLEDQWDNLNLSPAPYVVANVDPEAPGGLPQQTQQRPAPSAEITQALGAADDIKATTGLFDPSMGTNAAALALIRAFEGCELTPYRDSAGVLTVGVGHALKPGEDHLLAGVTPAEADRLLADDLKAAEQAVARWTQAPLTENQFGALCSLCFNIGGAAYRASTLRRLLNARRYADAALEFPKWRFSGGREVPGLVRRRLAEQALFLAPVPAPARDAH